MISLESTENLTVQSSSIVKIQKELNVVGGPTIPYECVYDFSKIPEYYHQLALQIITQI